MVTSSAAKRKLVLKMSISLDGFVCGPHGEVDRIFKTMGDPVARDWVFNTLNEAGTHVMGSETYYGMAAFWPYSDMPLAPPMNALPKVVFSRTGLKDGSQGGQTTRPGAGAGKPGVTPAASVLKSWAEPTVARGDLAEEMMRLKEQPGNYILAHGGARFARSLVASGLIDEYRMVMHPVALGQGQALFSGLESPIDLRLVSATSFGSGVVAIVYEPA